VAIATGMLDKATLTLGDNQRVDYAGNDFYDLEPGRTKSPS